MGKVSYGVWGRLVALASAEGTFFCVTAKHCRHACSSAISLRFTVLIAGGIFGCFYPIMGLGIYCIIVGLLVIMFEWPIPGVGALGEFTTNYLYRAVLYTTCAPGIPLLCMCTQPALTFHDAPVAAVWARLDSVKRRPLLARFSCL